MEKRASAKSGEHPFWRVSAALAPPLRTADVVLATVSNNYCLHQRFSPRDTSLEVRHTMLSVSTKQHTCKLHHSGDGHPEISVFDSS